MLKAPIVFKKLKFPFAAGLVLALFAALAVSGLAVQKVHADRPKDCDSNAIISCGFDNPADLINTIKKNQSGNGHTDLTAIYDHFGLESSDYDRFVKYSESGTAYKDGTIVVDGQTVATGGQSIGRLEGDHNGAGMFTEKVGSETLYGNSTQRTFGSDSLPVSVLFNAKGEVEFAVLQSCGNPELVTPVKSGYSCDSLQKTAVSGKPNTYNFTTTASQDHNAKIDHFVYSFGDGTPNVTTHNGATVVTHTFDHPANFTVKVTVYVNLPGNQQVSATSSTCQKVVTVPPPYYACLGLDGEEIDKATNTYSYTVTGKYANGAAPASASFSFGDGHTGTATLTGNGTSAKAITTHPYSKAGVYPVTAVLHFNAYGKSYTTPVGPCKTSVSVIVPFGQCLQLNPVTLDATKYSYSFTAVAKFGNGAKLLSGDFTYGDGVSAKGVKPTTTTTITVNHQYAVAGTYDILATLYFTANGKSFSAPTCADLVTPTAPPTQECKPGVPVGDVRCSPCIYDSSLPSDSTQCVAPLPPSLPNTGAGNTIAIFSAIVVAAFLGYRQLLFRKHKAAFTAAQMGTSALPLADPLSQEAPLAGTPLAPTRRGLRRKRPF